MTTTDKSKVFAGFMGCSFEELPFTKGSVTIRKEVVHGLLRFVPDWRHKTGVVTSGVSYRSVDTLKFHTSWDWLMPVVDKIASLEKENRENLVHNRDAYKHYNFVLEMPIGTRIQTVFELCLQFILWYNENSKS